MQKQCNKILISGQTQQAVILVQGRVKNVANSSWAATILVDNGVGSDCSPKSVPSYDNRVRRS